MTTRIRTTRIYYEGDGSTVDFAIPFDYLAKRFVQVYVDNVLKTGGDSSDLTKDYYFANPTTIRFRTAPASGTEVLLKRFTDATDRIVTFQDASVLLANDLNIAQIQTLHIAEEGRDIIDDALIVNTEGNWDARNRRIVNLADPVDPQDAMTYGMYQEDAEGANAARDEAVAAAEEAVAARDEAVAAAEEVAANTEIVLAAQEDVTNKHAEVVAIAAEINSKADEVLQQFEEVSQQVADATQVVLDTKDYIEEIVNNNVVQSGLACARSVWTLEEDLPAGTVIRIPGSPTYIVGRKHLFMSYDGVVMSPTFYNEIGDFNTASTQVSFNFDLFKGQELMAWVTTLGNSDSEIYDRLTNIEDSISQLQSGTGADITQLQADIDSLKEADTGIIERLDAHDASIETIDTELVSLKESDSSINRALTTLGDNDAILSDAIDDLKDTDAQLQDDVAWLKEHIGGESGEVVVKDGYKTITIDGVAISATLPEDTFNITAGENITLAADVEGKGFTISADVPEPPSVPLEIAIVDSLENVPSDLKVGGMALVKEGYDE